MQLFLGAVPIILRLFSKARGHLLFSNYSRNNLPKPSHRLLSAFIELLAMGVTTCMHICMLAVLQ